VVGRYILTPQILPILAQTARGRGGEVQLTDAIGTLLQQQPVYAHAFQGKRYDCGDKLGYLEATVAYVLEHETLGDDFRAVLQNYL
jgi:UTP--glucose-1-phosphate uridylyltransferase